MKSGVYKLLQKDEGGGGEEGRERIEREREGEVRREKGIKINFKNPRRS